MIIDFYLLGVVKRITYNIWIGLNSTVETNVPLLGAQELKRISSVFENLIIPLKYENSLQRKIMTGDGFSNLKSSEWLLYVMLSPLLLIQCIPKEQFMNWLTLVEISHLVCSTCISEADIDNVRKLSMKFLEDFQTIYEDPRYLSINFHMLLHLADDNLRLFGSGPSSWNFSYESRNKAIKSISTNGKSNLELTLMKKTLLQIHYEDYVNTMPMKEVLLPSIAASICSLVGNSDRDNVHQMSNVIKEYNNAVTDFNLDEFLLTQISLMYDFEQLPSSL